jgi:acyl-CoA synthetase (NDP forming)
LAQQRRKEKQAPSFSNFATNKLRGVFKGELYPINPKEEEILGFKCYETLSKVPGDVDLVVIIVSNSAVAGVLEEAGGKNTKAAVIISAGFKEVGNHKAEEEVIAVPRNMVSVCLVLTVWCIYAKTGVDSLFCQKSKNYPPARSCRYSTSNAGNIAMITQSGAFGSAALDYLTGRQMVYLNS